MADDHGALAAVERAFQEYHDDVYVYLLRRTKTPADAEDLTQDVFTDLVVAVRAARPPRSMEAWLYAIARRRFVDYLRRSCREASPIGRACEPIDDQIETHLFARPFCRLLARMPLEYRQVVVMRLLQGRSTREVAATLGTTEAACRMRLLRALRELRVAIAASGFAA
jgi:RNA polymerase sigma-70 factor (ECF subfamily)